MLASSMATRISLPLIAVASSFFSLASQADVRPGPYMGVGGAVSIAGRQAPDYESSITFDSTVDDSAVDSDNLIYEGFIGYRFASNNRINASLSLIDTELKTDAGTFKQQALGSNLDFHAVYGSGFFQPYWGVGAGFYKIDDVRDEFGVIGGESITGISMQLSAGLKLALTREIELDTSLRSRVIFWQEISDSSGTLSLIDSYSAINVGAAYKF